jgi:hypothetical protein
VTEQTASRIIERLSRAARRLRYSAAGKDWVSAFLDAAVLFARRVGLFWVDGGMARLDRMWTLDGEDGPADSVAIPLMAAPAFLTAVDSRDSVIALAAINEVSEPVVRLFGFAGDEKIALVPVVVRGDVMAVVLASGLCDGGINGLELIATLAGAGLEARTVVPSESAAELVSIRGLNL